MAAQDALGGGGRYDPLAATLGGPDTPAVGLAMGVDRIVLAMPEVAGEDLLDVFVVVADPDRREAALGLVASLRRAGLRVDIDLGGRSVKAQFRVAGRRQTATVAVVGSEWDEGVVTMRRMAGGEEQRISIEEVPTWARAR